MSASHQRRVAVGQLGATLRYRPDDAEALARLRADIKAYHLEDQIAEAVATAPPITLERAIHLADLLIQGAAAAQPD
jgi:hypothetical protein